MAKGIFTQGVCILLERALPLDELEAALANFDVRRRIDTSEEWAFGSPTLLVAYRPESNGLVSIDIVARKWPDQMGNPKDEKLIFSAWSMGHFGPFTYPGGLQRATQQCWAWKPGRTIPDRHNAFIRIRASYAFGAAGADPIMPSDYAPLPELAFVTQLASSLLNVPGALCYFNPNGEVLCGRDRLYKTLSDGRSFDLPSLDIWSNIRIFNVNVGWSLMDTVGNGQLDIPDVEACFHSESFDFNQIASFAIFHSTF